MARKKTPDNVTPIRKRTAHTKSIVETMAVTATGDGPFVPLDPVERYAWDRMWDMLIAKAVPHVIAYIQERDRGSIAA